MSLGGDCGLDLVLGFDDSFHNVLTRTMLNQEEIFRNQVLELHRLYQIQKIQMKELDLKAKGQESPHSLVGPFADHLKYEYLPTQIKSSDVHMTCSSRSVKNHVVQEHRGTLKHQQIPLDLELPASHYANDRKDLLPESHCFIVPEVSTVIKHGLYDDKMSSIEELKLSLSTYECTWHEGSGKRNCNDEICSRSPQTISLQSSTYGGNLVKFGAKCDLEPSGSFRSRKNDALDCVPESHSIKHSGPNLLEGRHFDQVFDQCDEDLCSKDTSARRKLFSSHEDGLLDLNKAPNESSLSHNEAGGYGKGTFLTVLDWRRTKNSSSIEPSLDQEDITNSTLKTNSSCPPSDSKDPGSCAGNFIPKNTESDISLPHETGRKMSMPEMDDNNNKEELLEGTDSNKSPVSCKSSWNADDVSSNTKTGKCGLSNSDVPPIQQKVVQSLEMRHHSSDQKKQELAEVDIVVRKGAVSLMYFSLECSDRTQDYVPESRKRKRNNNVEREVPESSSESYESIVLRQAECSVDEYCVSSTPSEVSGFDEKDYGVKLRRGRRMKDFRKEILPGLASLSRQEICEDVRIMELAIRSKEYKKYKSKIASRSDCFSSVRSRRSRLSYVGRRY
ncbi:hypothetical protein CDL12_01604 [Handroanthus impetiginosus]|uniref:Uncharacterized protein n=1 Tax=Handroanthus impetiginosus TaxID=429701 RepID=A0A2G9I7M7_9LAMI|nr:hypothetical protein CDL12_01604 [Handroanthus impetiginosus]